MKELASKGVEIEKHDYEYDVKKKRGKFHVKIHREIIKKV